MALEIDMHSTVDPNGVVTIRIRTGNNGIPVAEQIYLYRDGVQIVNDITQANGLYEHTETHPPTNAKQKFVYEATLERSTKKKLATVEIPERVSAPRNDPQRMTLIRRTDGLGNYRIFVRVVRQGGYGVETDVDILFRGQRFTIRTDARGIAEWAVPFLINPGDDDTAEFIVSGIDNHGAIRIRRRQAYLCPRRFSAQWWRTNNAVAFGLLVIAVVFTVWAFWLGIGVPLVHENMFKNPESGLSSQEQLYNNVMADAYEGSDPKINAPAIKPEVETGRWRHIIWKLALTFIIAWILFGITAMREEIGEEISLAVERIVNRDYVQTGDPLFERLVAWTGAYSVARNPTIATSDGSAPTPAPQRHSLFDELPTHLLSDFIVEIIPAFFRAVF